MYFLKILFLFSLPILNVYSSKILIIGAGPSGIATVSRLLDNNITDFIILEAENRIGGRIHSIPLGDAYIDLGAEYIHGEKGNLVYELVKDKLDLNLSKSPSTVRVYYDGEKKNENENLWGTFFQVMRESGHDGNPKGSSLGKIVTENFNSKVVSKYGSDPKIMSYSRKFLKTAQCVVLTTEGAFDWSEPSANTNYVDAEGEQNIVWQGLGYKTILEVLLKNFPNKTGYNIDDKIHFNKTVSKIILDSDKVNLKCEDGSEYSANHVVFTPSLGVLKHDHKEIFQPNLNDEKVQVIENLGFDGTMKVVLEFPETWWGDNGDFIFVWNDDEDERQKLIKEVPFGPIDKNGNHWLTWFFTMGNTPKNERIMIGWIVGPLVPQIEKLSEDQMKTAIMYALRKFLGKDYNIIEPTRVIHTNWCGNPHFRGTYSFETAELEKLNIKSGAEILLEPINDQNGVPRILFAGEATSPTRFSTVDGAIGTGFREADRLIKIWKNNS